MAAAKPTINAHIPKTEIITKLLGPAAAFGWLLRVRGWAYP